MNDQTDQRQVILHAERFLLCERIAKFHIWLKRKLNILSIKLKYAGVKWTQMVKFQFEMLFLSNNQLFQRKFKQT